MAAGGHNVPEPIIRGRWRLGLRSLFEVYLPLVDAWSVYDNAGEETVLVVRADPWTALRRLLGDQPTISAPLPRSTTIGSPRRPDPRR